MTSQNRSASHSIPIAVLATCSGVIFSSHGLAQSLPGAAAAASGPSNGSPVLQEITVTATRRAESIQKIPVSVSAFGSDDLQRLHIKSIEDIASLTPGLQFTAWNGFSSAFTTIAIRGFNTSTGATTVGLYLDDSVIASRLSGYTNQGNAYPYVFDLNRIEVARGPQGTLFGAGSEAGTVRFITNAPSLTQFTGMASTEIASTEGGRITYEEDAAAGGPIVPDSVGYRVSFFDRSDGGYVNRVDPITGTVVAPEANTVDKTGVKAALAFKLGGTFLLTPSFYYQRIHQDDAPRFYAAFSDPDEGIFNNGVLLPEVWTDNWSLSSLKLSGDVPFAELTVVGSYFDRNVSETLDQSPFVCPGLSPTGCGSPLGIGYPTSPQDVAYTPTGLGNRAYTTEVRLASNTPDAMVTWVAGLYFDHRLQTDYQISYDQQVVATAPTLAAALFQNQSERFLDVQAAAYAQTDIHFTSKLVATLGERISNVKVTTNEITGVTALAPNLQDLVSSSTANPTTPRIGLSYQADPNNLLYTSFSKGFRPGGGNAAGTFCGVKVPGTYAADTVQSSEIGAKNALFGARVLVDTSVFYAQWKNIQQLIGLPCSPIAYSTNAGNAASDGLDLSLRALLTKELSLDVNVGYVNAYYTKNAYDLAGNILVAKGDKVGLLPQVTPPWTAALVLEYATPLSAQEQFHAQVEAKYTSQSPGPFINQLQNSQNSFPLAEPDPVTHLYNLRIGYTRGSVDVTGFVNNVFNSTPALSKDQVIGISNLVSYTTFRPRTIGVSANVKF
jgi:iron complex outermembrane recepter protein